MGGGKQRRGRERATGGGGGRGSEGLDGEGEGEGGGEVSRRGGGTRRKSVMTNQKSEHVVRHPELAVGRKIERRRKEQ